MMINTILQGDVREVIKTIPDKFVDCIITSPPYYAVRDYLTGRWVGGDEACDHKGKPFRTKENININTNSGGSDVKNKQDKQFFKSVCKKCGAVRIDQQIGLEETPEQYIEVMVTLFREVRRVLKDHGTLWLNMGDSYWGGKGMNGAAKADKQAERKKAGKSFNHPWQSMQEDDIMQPLQGKHPLLKPKDMIGVPWRLALAMQADGWYLRQDIIWSKPNPMPESVTDRCTKSHEYVFLFSKSKKYFYDQYAILQPASEGTHARLSQDIQNQNGSERGHGGKRHNGNSKAWQRKFDPTPGNKNNESFDQAMAIMPNMVNKRSVWNVTTMPFSEAHFATFPPKLIVDPIKAGSSEKGNCKECGQPYVRIVRQKKPVPHAGETNTLYSTESTAGRLAKVRQAAREEGQEYENTYESVGWKKRCKCKNEEVVKPIIFDPFMGAGTTALVARKLGRNYLGVELNNDYIDIAKKRLKKELGLFE